MGEAGKMGARSELEGGVEMLVVEHTHAAAGVDLLLRAKPRACAGLAMSISRA
jgi:hypothetical protein